jgi:4-oxalocrotonate tautomerase
MPVVHIDIIKRPLAAKRKLVKAVTDAIVDSLGVSPESICIVINVMDKDQYATAGRLFADQSAQKKK